jgi:Zn-dependent protease with chaperone function
MMGTMNRFNIKNNINSIRNQELESDLTALEITRDPNPAKSCLLKLCHNDPNSLSHYFEFESEKIPAMTVNQRIQSWYT